MKAATFFDGEGWRDGIIDLDGERMLLRDEPPASDLPFSDRPRLDGVIIGGFTDHHVHLQLVDHALLHRSTLGRVVDLGANPAVIATLSAALRGAKIASADPCGAKNASESTFSGAFLTPHGMTTPHETPRRTSHPVSVEFAGAFLTPVGGYPSDRHWAPAGSFREIADTATAERAVGEMADAGASCIKVASNSSAGPVFSDLLFRAIVEAAAARGLPVVAHVEGAGEARRTALLGAARLAHAPFTERLDDAELVAQAASVSWISTLAIHDADGETRSTAVDNVRRFHEAGGTVLYGTDMGNGPTPVDLNPAELAALRDGGIDGTDLLRALAPQNPLDPASLLLRLPATDADPTLARPLTSADLKA
ncbi:hydrolase [Microbacterium sp. WCS2018Hpa-9]|uniref:amidohydrolase family protein n=1 Tax=Microbacterium sp. WCS2018Hpa-9 TaxID=3073635 RepID=UPI00288B1FBD|nr:hydrolase [Microbacterium sp. WCS2018Hpa-9]